MYGDEKMTPHHLLKYGLTKEFFERFAFLKCRGIEIPLALNGKFHSYIKPFVIKNLNNRSYLVRLQRKHKLHSMKDVQFYLQRRSFATRAVPNAVSRNKILIPAKFISFALDKLRNKRVIVLVSDGLDRKAIQGVSLPRSFKLIDFQKEIARVIIRPDVRKKVWQRIDRAVRANAKHPVFKQAAFRDWLFVQSLYAIKSITALDLLVQRNPIGLMMEHVEFNFPAATLALLARKYNIPYLTAPHCFVSDMSFIPFRGSHALVWGNNFKEWLERRGIPSRKIIVTGNMRFKYSMPKTVTDKSTFLKRYNIPSSHTIVTYTTQTYNDTVASTVMKWIGDATDNQLPVTFLIKRHPSDKFDYSAYAKHPDIKLLPQNEELYTVLNNSDIIISISSNTAVEAAMLGKALFVLQPPIPYDYNLNNNNYTAHLVHASAGPAVYKSSDLTKYLEKYIYSERARKEFSEQSGLFLKHTLQTSEDPAVLTKKLILSLIAKKLRIARKKQRIRNKLIRKRKLVTRKKRARKIVLKKRARR